MAEPLAATMEDFVMKLLEQKRKELLCFDWGEYNTVLGAKERFHRLSGQVNVLYMILTGHSNPLANPKNDT